ncbi:hypothetical protein ACFWC5_41240 [Streptomyces sp. NPDC060085]|uniref:hypothetical protein n=1 Tax=Streptomyces sp. NPDC060085 TaxID=3347054 RepID=UPI00365242D1
MRQFERLLKVVRERDGNAAHGGRLLPHEPHHTTAHSAVQQLAGAGVPNPPATAAAAHDRTARTDDALGQPHIKNHTLTPDHDRKIDASSRTHRFPANIQVITDADTKRMTPTAQPVPSNTADAKTRPDSDPAGLRQRDSPHRPQTL